MNIQEAKAHLRTKEPSIDEFEAWREHRALSEQANRILINDKYDMAVMQKVLFYADKLGRDEQSEGYDKRYEMARSKADKLLNSARLTRELKIKALEDEITAINRFQNTIRDLSCFRISLEMEIEEDLEREEKKAKEALALININTKGYAKHLCPTCFRVLEKEETKTMFRYKCSKCGFATMYVNKTIITEVK